MSADAVAPRAEPRVALILRISIAVAGLCLIGASRLPWFDFDVEAAQIADRYLLSDDVWRGIIGYRVGSDRFIIAALGALIALTAGLWSWRVGTLLARPLLLLFSGLAIVWSTLAMTEAGTVPSKSDVALELAASLGPITCLILGVIIFVATIFARLSASDLGAVSVAISRQVGHGRAPAAVVLSRRLVRSVARVRGPGHPDSIRAALTYAQCLFIAGFPDLADAVLVRVEARPELAADSDAVANARVLRDELVSVLDKDGKVRPDFMGR